MYAPGITYQTGQLGAAIGDVADNLQKAFGRTEEIRKQNALNDPLMEHALETGRITQEQYNKYHEANFTTKAALANGVMANVHEDWQRQMFQKEEEDKAMQRALSLKIAEMAHAPSPMAFKPIFGPPPDAGDQAYAERGLDVTPTGAPVPTQGPQIGVWGQGGNAQFYPWREVMGLNPDGTPVGSPVIDNTILPGSTVVTVPGTKQLKIVPNLEGKQPGAVLTGEDIPANTYTIGPKGNLITLPKDVRQRLEDEAQPTPAPTPKPLTQRAQDAAYNATIGRILGTPTPTPIAPGPTLTPTPTPLAPGPLQTPVPSVVAPNVPAGQRVIILDPQGKGHTIPAERLPDYLNAGWTQPPAGWTPGG